MSLKEYWVVGANNRVLEYYRNSSVSSPRVNGKLTLVQNPHQFLHSFMTGGRIPPPLGSFVQSASTGILYFPFTSAMENEVLAKFRGQLSYGSASLGMTLGTLSQTREMINSRFAKATSVLGRARRYLSRRPLGQRPRLRDRASDVLEFEFGWRPLYEDVHAALTSAIEHANPSAWVRASGNWSHYEIAEHTDLSVNPYANPIALVTKSGKGTMTCAAAVSVSNPNLWLLNRLGLINPATILWDKIRWTFLVNQFVNLNDIIESVTTTVGLNVGPVSITRSGRMLKEFTVRQNPLDIISSGVVKAPAWGGVATVTKDRVVLGSLPIPSLEFRVPGIDWEKAVIAGSLLTQNFAAISRLLRP